MRIDNQFVVPATPERAWEFLTDLGRVAPCVPGATVESVEGEALTGRVALRIGPMNMTYTGEARFLVKDEVNKVATIEVGGRDGRGGGTVKAKIKAGLTEVSGGTQVTLATDLGLTGRVAQLGQGPIKDVSSKLMRQFADSLASRIDEPAPAVGSPVAPAVEAEPINLLDGSLVPKKQLAGAAAGLVALVLAFLLGRSVGRRETR
ncbi:SRPBCC family protein [Nonomuraea harbinensis]|uniref:SRPBCC family protein n=1 Tax=Nonomuraea harbinensis TaxID=1286938 RepID=A0ABW1C8C0_9ACTN|nr:SRPBCC family protein [Nonomuraea harbinensis]